MTLAGLANRDPWEWPDDAKAVILEALRDETLGDEDRELAARLAGNSVVVDDELFEELLRLVREPGECDAVRSSAAIALGPALEMGWVEEFDEPDEIPISEEMYDRARAALREQFSEPDLSIKLRRRILEASVRAPDDWHRQAVRDAWASDDSRWRLTAAFCMEYVGGFEAEILEALESDDDEIFFQAVCAAGAQGVEEAWPHVAGVLESGTDNVDLLLAAIQASISIGGGDANSLLADLLEDDDEEIADQAMHALRMIALLDPDSDELDLIDSDEDGGFDDDDLLVH